MDERALPGVEGGAVAARGQAQEFVAGAHPAQKELVLRLRDGSRLLMVAVDESCQRRLADLFARFTPRPEEPTQVVARWRVLHVDDRPAAARLDVAFKRPLRVEVRVLFSMGTSVAVRHAAHAAHVCLVTRTAFDQLERSGACGDQAIVLPNPPTDAIARAAVE